MGAGKKKGVSRILHLSEIRADWVPNFRKKVKIKSRQTLIYSQILKKLVF